MLRHVAPVTPHELAASHPEAVKSVNNRSQAERYLHQDSCIVTAVIWTRPSIRNAAVPACRLDMPQASDTRLRRD